MINKKPDYKITGTINTKSGKIDNVICSFFLPKRLTDPIEINFDNLTTQQSNQISHSFEFSIYCEIRDHSGKIRQTITADKVYIKDQSSTYWGFGTENYLAAEPTDLKIINFLNGDEPKNEESHGNFWLTPCNLLNPAKILERSYTGEVKIRMVRNLEFQLTSDLQLSFNKRYRYISNKDDTISFSELVAEFDIPSMKFNIDLFLNNLDEFLAITSFAARTRCICLGWENEDGHTYTKVYRRGISIPEKMKDNENNLINLRDFEEFINHSYKIFLDLDPKTLVLEALYRAVPFMDQTIDSSFFTIFSGIEALVLFHRKNQHREFILDDMDEWKAFRKDLEAFIKSHNLFSADSDKRRYTYEKIPELNRVSFGTAFKEFTEFYNIYLQDLWPLTDQKEGISLSEIRNRIIHGDTFSRKERRALVSAKEHLEWIFERSILGILGWSINKSYVSPQKLGIMTMYRDWKEDRKEFKTS
jgi:hypothetical protein